MSQVSIAHISYQTTWRGGEQQAAYLMKELYNRDVNQLLVAPAKSPLMVWAKKEGIETLEVQKRTVWSFAKHVAFLKGKFLIHAHDSNSHTAGVIANSLFNSKIKLIVSRRVDFPIGNSLLKKWKYNHSSIQKIICVSKAIERIMAPSITKEERLCTIHSGIDFSRFEKSVKSSKLHELVGLNHQTRIVGNVAALAPHKDYFTWLKAAKEIAKKSENVHFVTLGDGPQKNEIHQFTNELGLQNRVTHLGFRDNISELLPCFDVFMFSSETEGLGTSVIDAMACSIPVSATNAGGVSELVIHESTGLLCAIKEYEELAENTLRIIEDSELRSKLIQNAREHIKSFDKRLTASKTLNVYSTIFS